MTVIGVLGELLITAGILVLAFLGWQIWLGDLIMGAQLDGEAHEITAEWQKGDSGAALGAPDDPPVPAEPANAQTIGVMLIPRFGDDYARPIAQGIGIRDVLNEGRIGHYPGTQMPGEIGNFSVAAHRTAYGGNFHNLDELRIGDRIYIETEAGWYSYVFRNLEYVHPTGVGVIDPVPQTVGVEATDRLITLTTCNPLLSVAERIVAYGVFDRWYPRADGPPDELAAIQGAG